MNLQKQFELYKAGDLSSYNFLREARMAYPRLVTQHNSIDDAVYILKNNGLVFEEYAAPESTSPLDVLESAIRYELSCMDCNVFDCTNEQYMEAREKAEKNLAKDPAHYVNLKAEVKPTDADKMKPATSQNMVDDENGMKIQKLHEAILTVALKKMLTEDEK